VQDPVTSVINHDALPVRPVAGGAADVRGPQALSLRAPRANYRVLRPVALRRRPRAWWSARSWAPPSHPHHASRLRSGPVPPRHRSRGRCGPGPATRTWDWRAAFQTSAGVEQKITDTINVDVHRLLQPALRPGDPDRGQRSPPRTGPSSGRTSTTACWGAPTGWKVFLRREADLRLLRVDRLHAVLEPAEGEGTSPGATNRLRPAQHPHPGRRSTSSATAGSWAGRFRLSTGIPHRGLRTTPPSTPTPTRTSPSGGPAPAREPHLPPAGPAGGQGLHLRPLDAGHLPGTCRTSTTATNQSCRSTTTGFRTQQGGPRACRSCRRSA